MSSRTETLRAVAVFSRLPERALTALAERLTERAVPPGARLITQGEAPDGLLVIVSGTAEVRLRRDGRDAVLLATLGPLSVVGEMALITLAPRNADVAMPQGGEVLFLSLSDFAAIEREVSEVVDVLTELVAQRLGRAAQDGLGDKVLEGYRILRPVGRGATAVVYQAERLGSGAPVALKMLSHRLARDGTAMASFEREAEVLLRLRHPGIALCLGRFDAYGTRFLVIEYVDGPALSEVTRAVGPFSERDARAVVGSIAATLIYVHDRAVLHGDIKPANILVGADGTVRLTDFGLATALEESSPDFRADALRLSGTPRYMAPELFLGRPRSVSTDAYALGCVLFELLVGAPAFPMEAIGPLVLAKRNFVLGTARAGLPSVSQELVHATASLLDPNPRTRAASLASLARDAGNVSPEMVARVVAARSAPDAVL